jgi:hypothetical protein
VRSQQARCIEQIRDTAGVLVHVSDAAQRCGVCGGPTRVQKTVRRYGKTLQHGEFEARESVPVCAGGCRHPCGNRATRRAVSLAQCIEPGRVIGYDVMVLVGLKRFVEHCQREEIRAALEREHGIRISSGEISVLAARFADQLEALHHARAEALRAELERDGGWPLHIDATGEDGRGTLLVAYAGWRKWVLSAWKIPSERADQILPHLQEVVGRFGRPCAVMRDLGRAMQQAAADLVADLGEPIPILACHLHFLRDVGNDLLDSSYGALRSLFRRFKIRPALRTLARDLACKLGPEITPARQAVLQWQQGDDATQPLPDGQAGLATVRALVQWVLDYSANATGDGMPFDRPYLDLYERCQKTHRALSAFLRTPPSDRKVCRAARRLQRILDPLDRDLPFTPIVRQLKTRTKLFDQLRDALRLTSSRDTRRGTSCAPPDSPGHQVAELNDIRDALDRFTAALAAQRPARGPAQDTRKAIDLVLDHLERHGDYLWGHVISLPPVAGGGIRLVERTNNLLEGFFHVVKHAERRRSGRKILTRDMECLPPAAMLAFNLTRQDYVATLCGSLARLPQAFAELDERKRAHALLQPTDQQTRQARPVLDQPASTSLPAPDRKVVRSEAMTRRILNAGARVIRTVATAD